jgi:hypothetical protein
MKPMYMAAAMLMLLVGTLLCGCTGGLANSEKDDLDSLDARGVALRYLQTKHQTEIDYLSTPEWRSTGLGGPEGLRDPRLKTIDWSTNADDAVFSYNGESGETWIRLSREKGGPWRVYSVDSGG